LAEKTVLYQILGNLPPAVKAAAPDIGIMAAEELVNQVVNPPKKQEGNPVGNLVGNVARVGIGAGLTAYGARALAGAGNRIAKNVPIAKMGPVSYGRNVSGTKGAEGRQMAVNVPVVGGTLTVSTDDQSMVPKRGSITYSNPAIPGLSKKYGFSPQEDGEEGFNILGRTIYKGTERRPKSARSKPAGKKESEGQVEIDYGKNYTGSRKLVSDEMLAKAGIQNTSSTQDLSARPDVEAAKKKQASPKGVGILREEKIQGDIDLNVGNNDIASVNRSTNPQDNLAEQLVVPGTTMTNQYDSHAFGRVDQTAEALNTRDDFGAGFTSQVEAMGLGKYNLQPSAVRVSERGGLDTDMRLNPRYRLEKDPEATVQRGAIRSAVGKMEDDTATDFLRDFADSYVAAKGTQRFEGRA
jgi:hypothetical protein